MANILTIFGGTSLVAWVLLIMFSAIPKTRHFLSDFFINSKNTNPSRVALLHLKAIVAGAVAIASYALFLNSSGHGIKQAILPFGSVELWLLMYTGGGSTLMTTLWLLGRVSTLGSYVAGYLLAGFFFFEKFELFTALACCIAWLVPFLIVSIIIKVSKK